MWYWNGSLGLMRIPPHAIFCQMPWGDSHLTHEHSTCNWETMSLAIKMADTMMKPRGSVAHDVDLMLEKGIIWLITVESTLQVLHRNPCITMDTLLLFRQDIMYIVQTTPPPPPPLKTNCHYFSIFVHIYRNFSILWKQLRNEDKFCIWAKIANSIQISLTDTGLGNGLLPVRQQAIT